MQLTSSVVSALIQVGFILAVAWVVFSISKLLTRGKSQTGSFSDFIGFRSAKRQLDLTFLWILLAFVVFGVVSTALELRYVESLRQLLMSQNSPYGKILKDGFNGVALAEGALYCFVQSAGAEEILFRGLIAKRLFRSMGPRKGNIAQAAVFWLMHLAIFRAITGQWFSALQLIAFATSFGGGLILGYANLRKDGESILPSWSLHGCVNFATFLSLAVFMR